MILGLSLLPWFLAGALLQEGQAPAPAPPEEPQPTHAEVLEMLGQATGAKAGPTTGAIGTLAEVAVPEGLSFADAAGAKRLLEFTGNVPDESVLGAVLSLREDADWFVIFSFDESGYVKDDEQEELDADALLAALREGQDQGNAVRKERGLDTLEVVGWEKPPFYDPKTNNLTWATRIRSSSGGETVNWEVRLLGRRGVMSAALVIGPGQLQAALPQFETLLGGYAFREGHKYAEFRAGDKVAEYGLGALVLGGAGVAAAKLGFFSKFWKVLLLGVAAIGAFLKNSWSRLFGRKEPESGGPPPLQG